MRSFATLTVILALGLLLAGCSALLSGVAPEPTRTSTPTPTPTARPTPTATLEPLPTEEPTPDVESFELRAAIDQRVVSAKGTGDGLESLDLTLTSKVDRPIEVRILAGTLLEPKASATQRMVVAYDATVELEALETDTWSLNVACVEMRQHQPSSDDHFVVLPDEPEADLIALLQYPGYTDETFRVQQFSVWTITNNPRRSGYQPLGTQFDIFGSGPDAEEFESIRALFEGAGIDTADYRALR